MNIREEFHQLIDSVEDEKALKSYYRLIYLMNKRPALDREAEKEEMRKAYGESLEQSNLMDYDRIRYEQRKHQERD